ncbi:nitrate assimilation protein, narQ [Methanothermobacter thermautotrophicus str. Delta H]|uniref:Sulfur carrier protein FdhD n=1 Tax=Methanothermobacter thermautotrophicus (strain ATCC 29096 / DSM 1053 / JCM 10044 / NBRC 100330 / Delta H) TaxID=187420 RepID=FDHD_METTH|nr:formate dehydrogenase accessory sulfurtransferase FdhD [Methanothermobacter thermautotrophicus]O27590.1 RecName: Full=Sulfur carrier protein FdhD [Methanothermobacter thermautotrophicus str. Delta H]AAB86021.1 nitrate assimilation protein, narQ [Methanothermobacter thermautotrophicus str. Delta H]WBF06045.1 formate dehydrogenase accessory sulfurtransferase FdhD [Methanothermobacter thermautotrophicus]
MSLYREVDAFRVDDERRRVPEKVVNDIEVRIRINGGMEQRFTASPQALEEFATGYLLGEGLVDSVDDIVSIEISDNIIDAEIESGDLDIRRELVMGSDCFGGWRQRVEMVGPVDSDLRVRADDIFLAFKRMVKSAVVWRMTGGTHVAALVTGDEFRVFEDVSRHVAVDKVIGSGAMDGVNFRESFIVYSGRMPADMLIKVVRAGVPIIASNAAPTSSGYDAAQRTGLTMLGFVRGKRFNIYSHPERII